MKDYAISTAIATTTVCSITHAKPCPQNWRRWAVLIEKLLASSQPITDIIVSAHKTSVATPTDVYCLFYSCHVTRQ